MRDKLGRFIKGHHISPDTEFKKGHIPSNTGKILSEKTKKKISKGNLGKHHSPTTEFKKGHISWSKLHPELMPRGEKHHRFGKHLSGKNAFHWKGGKTKGGYGYIFIFKPKHPFCECKGYVREHRLVMEKAIGRYLTREEVVHHINEIKSDNRIDNLMLFKNMGAHRKFHIIQKGMKSDEIIFDGRTL